MKNRVKHFFSFLSEETYTWFWRRICHTRYLQPPQLPSLFSFGLLLGSLTHHLHVNLSSFACSKMKDLSNMPLKKQKTKRWAEPCSGRVCFVIVGLLVRGRLGALVSKPVLFLPPLGGKVFSIVKHLGKIREGQTWGLEVPQGLLCSTWVLTCKKSVDYETKKWKRVYTMRHSSFISSSCHHLPSFSDTIGTFWWYF